MHQLNKVKLIAGLGNPGDKYEGTRHNAGFMVLDELMNSLRGTFKTKMYHNAILFEGNCKGEKLLLVKPLTFMNLSGEAVELIARKNDILPNEIVALFDDMDLPLGKIRIKKGGGGSGGHNGVESIAKELKSSDFARVRIGIGRGDVNEQIDHVLSQFNKDEKELFAKVAKISTDAIKLVLYRGLKEAMNKYNGLDIESIEKI